MVDAVDFFAGKYLSGAERNLANLASPSGGRFRLFLMLELQRHEPSGIGSAIRPAMSRLLLAHA